MFGSYWLRRLAALGIATSLIYLIISGALGVWGQYTTSSQSYREYQQQTEYYEREATEKIVRECAFVIPFSPAFRNCLLYSIQAYQQEDRSKRDLKAQQDMAYWAMILTIISAVGIGISAVAVWVVILSLRQTRTAISDTREIGEAQVRAYLSFVMEKIDGDITIGFDNPEGVSVEFNIVNSGLSPARNVRYLAAISIREHPIAHNNDLVCAADGQILPNGNLHQGQEWGCNATGTELFDKKDVAEAFSPNSKTRIHIFGIIEYTDVFNELRKTRFCYYLAPHEHISDDSFAITVSRWTQSPTHNDAT